ncbi:MAG: GNAT family N-acetyltransferase [Sphingobacteriaceae bacterium]|nr:GNAT family N-acetyltransferase [Sphingobacteriaceae bacterium]
MQEVKLSKASLEDIPTISLLADLIWRQHYISLIGESQVNYMLDLMYSKDSLQKQMLEKLHQFYLIQLNKEDIGFISVNEVSSGNWFLNKFYVDQNKAAKGIGTFVFNTLNKQLSPKKITLTVNKGNFKSINFYFKLGFTIEKTEVFEIGNGYVMDDFVMVWNRIK